MDAEAPVLSLRNLCVDYIGDHDDVRAVQDVSFDIHRGEIFGLAGESGCGKSTIAYAITRVLRPPALISGGDILFRGIELAHAAPAVVDAIRWRRIAMVFQNAMSALNPVATIASQFTDVIRTHRKCSRAEAEARAVELMALVDIPPERLRAYPHQFSGGMKQRIVIAMCLALEPELIILDEPTTALDVVVQRDIMNRILALQRRFGFAILLITHDLELMAEFCDRIAIMREGRIVESGPAERIHRAPAHDYTKMLWSAVPRLSARIDPAEILP